MEKRFTRISLWVPVAIAFSCVSVDRIVPFTTVPNKESAVAVAFAAQLWRYYSCAARSHQEINHVSERCLPCLMSGTLSSTTVAPFSAFRCLKDMFTRCTAGEIYRAVDFDPIAVGNEGDTVWMHEALIVPFHIYNLERALA